MSVYSKIGVTIVLFALISYSIGIFVEQRKKKILPTVVIFLTLGVIFDFLATIFMIVGSGKGFSLHGFLGYTSFTMMLLDTIWIWKTKLKKGINSSPSPTLHRFSLVAYIWWIAAFITGGLLVAIR